ncbi:hypothetical protein IHI24_000899 [Rickettsia endosymbiont of Cardiosporidium cionae]|nr:hypothetical protein IHI24_000899 [Rickettsia endosymbiont of Cardiosporidium cionae]
MFRADEYTTRKLSIAGSALCMSNSLAISILSVTTARCKEVMPLTLILTSMFLHLRSSLTASKLFSQTATISGLLSILSFKLRFILGLSSINRLIVFKSFASIFLMIFFTVSRFRCSLASCSNVTLVG